MTSAQTSADNELRKTSKAGRRNDSIDYSKIKPNQEVCQSIHDFIRDRQVIDPIVIERLEKKPTSRADKDQLLANLRKSQKQMQFRCHPWVSDVLRQQIADQEQNKGQAGSQASASKQDDDEVYEDEIVQQRERQKSAKPSAPA